MQTADDVLDIMRRGGNGYYEGIAALETKVDGLVVALFCSLVLAFNTPSPWKLSQTCNSRELYEEREQSLVDSREYS